jgi:3-dehydroquinate synthase II
MKTVWIKAIPWKKEIVTTALESGADAVMVPKGCSSKVKKLGVITTIADDGDLRLGKDVVEWEIRSKADEEKILALSRRSKVIVRTRDWTVIPLENLIAQTSNLIVEVKTAREAKTALKVLEKGVDGVILNTRDLAEIKKTVAQIKESSERISLQTVQITRVETLGMGDRVCIDTCSNMAIGEGMLVGNSSSGLFLVHAESVQNPYVEPRPFRVNAGPVHAYVRVPEGKTRYLSELRSGDEVTIVNYKGHCQNSIVGRIKVEKRPLMFIEAECRQKTIATILQNAETIRLTQPNGSPISVVDLKKGSRVQAFLEEAGRHFGMKIKETITEK